MFISWKIHENNMDFLTGDTPISGKSPYAYIKKHQTSCSSWMFMPATPSHPSVMTEKFQISSLDAFKTRIQKGATDSKSSQNLGFFLSLPSKHWRFTHIWALTEIWVSENWVFQEISWFTSRFRAILFSGKLKFHKLQTTYLGIMGSPTKIIHGGWL